MSDSTTKKNIYWTLFHSTFTLSAFTFGGGYVIVPLMRKKFVEDYQWIEEKEMYDLIAISQSSPGPIAVNASIIIGYRIAGYLGALVAILGTVLPPFIIISVISLFYAAFRDNLIISLLLKGMQAGVAAVIIDVVLNMAKPFIKEKNILHLSIMLGAFIATYVLKLNVVFIIMTCITIGIITSFRDKEKTL